MVFSRRAIQSVNAGDGMDGMGESLEVIICLYGSWSAFDRRKGMEPGNQLIGIGEANWNTYKWI